MSSQTTKAIELARSKVNNRALNNFLDNQRRAFLDKLHVASQPLQIPIEQSPDRVPGRSFRAEAGEGGGTIVRMPCIRLSEWESHFVADLIVSPRPFTEAQRAKIDELRRDYEHRLQ